MRKYGLVILFALSACISAVSGPHTTVAGEDSVSAQFFRDWYHRSDLVYYLEALDDHSIVETTTYGQWWRGERLTLSVEGLPHYLNRYYIDGMRVDDVFQPGNTQYVPNMEQYDMLLQTHQTRFFFTQDTTAQDYVSLTGNVGHLSNGEPMAGTTEIFNIAHRSPMQSADTYKHVSARRHIRGAGTVDAAYTIRSKDGRRYRQHLLADYGRRMLTREDERGLILNEPYYAADYYRVQADGYLPMPKNEVFSDLGYMLNFSQRGDAGSEYLFNYDEVYRLQNYSATLFAKRQYLTTGLTWASNLVRHKNLGFGKNIIDQDGESFMPFVADGNTHTLSWAVNYKQPLTDWLNVHIDAYNTLLHFRPTEEQFSNSIYLRSPVDESATDLYRYDWTSSSFTGGLLENTIGVDAHYQATEHLSLSGAIDLTLDGMLLRKKSKVTPNIEASFTLGWTPARWFELGLTLAHKRLHYTADYLRYFSDDYMNGEVRLSDGTLLATTGGRYHHYADKLWQTSYFELDIPLHFRFGRHEIVLQQSYKKYYHVWQTHYQGDMSDYGYYKTQDDVDIWYLQNGEKQYEVGYDEAFGKGFIRNTPYYFSQLTRYTYNGRKVYVSVSWQSMQAAGYSALGNGPTSNTLGILSETSANPNTGNVVNNQGGEYRGVGRLDLDKGYVCRIYVAYNICKWVQAGVTMKWTDGKPFSAYQYYRDGSQVAILPTSSRGTNPTDGDFGTRHCAKYNIDLHVQGKWTAGSVPMTLRAEVYNIYDFCHDLAEMAFVQDIPYAKRASMIMDIPIGMLMTYTIEL